MATFQKYPVYTYDEPATYDDFRGGINLDPSSENIADNELRDCVNMEYSHVTLQKRKGAKRLCRLICKETLNFIQGITIFTKENSFIIVAADGKLYYSLYIPNVDLELEQLHIFDFDINKLGTDIKQEYGIEPNNISQRTLKQFVDLPVYNYERKGDLLSNGYVLDKPKKEDYDPDPELIFQTKNKIEFASYNNKLYAATGTRLVTITVNEDRVTLTAICAAPYIPNGVEYQLYGENFMSPYPYECIQSGQGAAAAIKNIIFYPSTRTDIGNDKAIIDKDIIVSMASMIYPSGRGPKDYFFKWDIYDYSKEENKYRWRTLISFKDSKNSIDKDSSKITIARKATMDKSYRDNENNYLDIDKDNLFYVHTSSKDSEQSQPIYDGKDLSDIKLRCTFTDSLTEDKDNPGEYIPTKLDGSYFGSFQSGINIKALNNTEATWRIIQSCKKIIADGNKFILYDDAYNSGSWFKTVIGKPGYITNRGSLNFKTTKNEQLIKVVHFKGVLIAFSHSKLIGGNISVVTGNGDDDPMDQSYSPYIRKVINSEITCDSPSTVQIAENLLFFKFRDTVYAIEGSNISSEIITLFSMNDKLKQPGALVDIPWEEECVSEITEDYYGLIWKEQIAYDNGEAYVSRPAMRLKMYYKIGQDIDGKVFFPWLRDESPVFNTDSIIYIDGTSTHFRDMELLQYNNNNYLDIDKPYDSTIKLKAYDLNYPKIYKFIRNIMLYYNRSESDEIDIDLSVENEAGHLLIDKTCSKDSLQDINTIANGYTSGKLGKPYTDTKVYNAKHLFPLLQATTIIKVKCNDLFTINSITFNYYTTDIPINNPYDSYVKIIKTSTPINRYKLKTKESIDKSREIKIIDYSITLAKFFEIKDKELNNMLFFNVSNINKRFNNNKNLIIIKNKKAIDKKIIDNKKEQPIIDTSLKAKPSDIDSELNKRSYQEIINCKPKEKYRMFIVRGGNPKNRIVK